MQLECPDPALLMRICGQGDENLEFLESKQNVRVLRRGELITVAGDEEKDVRQAHALLLQIRDAAQDGHQFRPQDFRYVLETLRKNGHVDVASLYSELLCITYRGKPVRPRRRRRWQHWCLRRNRCRCRR